MSRYIDADAFLKYFDELQKPTDIGFGEEATLLSIHLSELVKTIKEFPTADVVECKRGEWKFYSRDEDAFDVYGNESWAIRYYCSNCNFMHAFIENNTAQYNYCPNCGARMKGAEDDKR